MSLRNRVAIFILGILGSLIAIELSRRNIATQVFTWEIRGVEFFYIVLGILVVLVALSLISIILEIITNSTDPSGNTDSDDGSSNDWSVDQLVGCISHEGVKWIGSKDSSGASVFS